MRGFVFTQFVEMIEQEYGLELADRLLDTTDLASGGAYTAVDDYDHGEMVQLVKRLSELIEVPVPDLLKSFGERLFGYLVRSHAQLMLKIEHPFDLFSQLENHVHAEVRKLYANAEVPYFETRLLDSGGIVLNYRSSRALPDLAEGLIVGACRHFGHSVSIRREDRSAGRGTEVDFFVELSEP